MYLCYVDEAGSLDVDTKRLCRDAKEKPYIYVLCGVCVLDFKWSKFSGIIDDRKDQLRTKIKQTRGLDLSLADCELKSSWIRIPKLRRERQFLSNLSPDELTALVNLCYYQIEYAKMTLFAIVVDKRNLLGYMDQEKLHRKAWELLLERVENFMRERHDRHNVIFLRDDVSRQANQNLAEKHAYLLRTQATSGQKLGHVIEMPLFVRSELSNGIQLADFAAYNFYHAFSRKKLDYEHFQRILPYVYNSANTPSEKLDGLKVFPPESELTPFASEIGRLAGKISEAR